MDELVSPSTGNRDGFLYSSCIQDRVTQPSFVTMRGEKTGCIFLLESVVSFSDFGWERDARTTAETCCQRCGCRLGMLVVSRYHSVVPQQANNCYYVHWLSLSLSLFLSCSRSINEELVGQIITRRGSVSCLPGLHGRNTWEKVKYWQLVESLDHLRNRQWRTWRPTDRCNQSFDLKRISSPLLTEVWKRKRWGEECHFLFR